MIKSRVFKSIKIGVKAEIEEIKQLEPTQAQRKFAQVLVNVVIMALVSRGIPAPSEQIKTQAIDITSIVICDLFSGLVSSEKMLLVRILKAYKAIKESEKTNGSK